LHDDIIIGKKEPLHWQKHYQGTVSATGAGPGSEVVGGRFQ